MGIETCASPADALHIAEALGEVFYSVADVPV